MGVFLLKYAIVGIDPGVTSGVALLDLDGEVIRIKSKKNFSLRGIIRFLSAECTPLVIASDVFPAQKPLEKVAAAFSAMLHEPDVSLSRKSKSDMVRNFKIAKNNKHKKDALAAALTAYESIQPLLTRIEKKLEKKGISDHFKKGDILNKIISGESTNIDMALKSDQGK